jgi:hypothetical protein
LQLSLTAKHGDVENASIILHHCPLVPHVSMSHVCESGRCRRHSFVRGIAYQPLLEHLAVRLRMASVETGGNLARANIALLYLKNIAREVL